MMMSELLLKLDANRQTIWKLTILVFVGTFSPWDKSSGCGVGGNSTEVGMKASTGISIRQTRHLSGDGTELLGNEGDIQMRLSFAVDAWFDGSHGRHV
jgi:hypothetical protein